jgi:proline racemase
VAVQDGAARSATLRNVPSFLERRDAIVELDDGPLVYDLAFGGNFYAIVDAASARVEVGPEHAAELIETGARVMAAIEAADRPLHPTDERIAGLRHVIFTAPGRDGADARAAVSIHPGWLDRSPCGTGTSARMAQLHARGKLALNEPFVHESVIGTRFTGRLVEETEVGGRPAVVPEITGRAWITGMGQYLLDPTDPFPAGFAL